MLRRFARWQIPTLLLSLLLPMALSSVHAHAADGAVSPDAPVQLLVDPLHHHVFGPTWTAGVQVFDYNAQVIATVPVSQGGGEALSPDDSHLYVVGTMQDRRGIAVIDTATLAVASTWTPPSFCPQWLSVSNGRLWMGGLAPDCGGTSGAIASAALDFSDFRMTTATPNRTCWLATAPTGHYLACEQTDNGSGGLLLYQIDGTALNFLGYGNYQDDAKAIAMSNDGRSLLVNVTNDTPNAGASQFLLPDIQNPTSVYYAHPDQPEGEAWTDNDGYVVLDETSPNGGWLLYYTAGSPGTPLAQFPSTYILPHDLTATPDGSLVFTSTWHLNSNGDFDGYQFHAYPGPAPTPAPDPSSSSPAPTPSATNASPSPSPSSATTPTSTPPPATATAAPSPNPSADRTAPTMTVRLLPIVTTASSQTVAWTASDTQSGVASYDVRYRSASYHAGFGAWTLPSTWRGTTATHLSLKLAPGRDYCLELRATDHAGNVSAWSRQRCVARLLDDRALRASTGWQRNRDRHDYLGTFTHTSRPGARLALSEVQADRIGLLARTCRSCGVVAVYVGRHRIGRLDLHSQNARMKLFLLPRFSLRSNLTVTIRTLSGGYDIRVDGLALTQT